MADDLHPLDAAYRERAHLVAHLATIYPAWLVEMVDHNGYALLYITMATGQMSWHIAPWDLDLFAHVPRCSSFMIKWDGHTTEEKYRRLDAMTADLAKHFG